MNRVTALLVLGLEPGFTKEVLVKQYRLESLKHHPDKNGNSPESTARFQQINSAYITLLNGDNGYDASDVASDQMTSYRDFFLFFVRSMFNDNCNSFNVEEALLNIVATNYDKLLATLDKQTAISTYEFMHEYADILYLRPEDLERMRAIVAEKMKADDVVILNPTLSDLFNKKVYRLEYDGQHFMVPLWHNEIYYPLSGERELIVRCIIQDMPDHIYIDENNNMTINVRTSVQRALDSGSINISIPVSPTPIEIKIPASSLVITACAQTYRCLEHVGIPKINTRNVFDASVLAHIDVCFTLY
jgi:curved DNA-binding protein CbpA